jgi:sugar lactone lactonase YvrE
MRRRHAGVVRWVTAIVAVLALTCTSSAAADWGGAGGGDGQFVSPGRVAVGPDGAVAVADASDLGRVQLFSADGAFAWSAGGLSSPHGLGIDRAGSVFVADTANDRIVKFGSDGNVLTTWGSTGAGEGQFRGPVGVAVDTADRVYVLDTAGIVQQFTSDGAFIARWTLPPEATVRPSDVAVAPDGDVLALDGGSGTVTVLSPDGVVTTSFAAAGSGLGPMAGASGITTDSMGEIYVADSGNGRVERFTEDGAFRGIVPTMGRSLTRPVDVAVGADGTLYVVDAGSASVVTLEQAAMPVGASDSTIASLTTTVGRVLAHPPGGRRFAPVKGTTAIDAGWVIDARHGTVTVHGRPRGPGTSSSAVRLRAGIVSIRLRESNELELTLTGGTFGSCSRKRPSTKVIRRASVDVTGTAVLTGRDSAVRGRSAAFTVEDSCAGTRTRVQRGSVVVSPARGGASFRLAAPHARRVADHG